MKMGRLWAHGLTAALSLGGNMTANKRCDVRRRTRVMGSVMCREEGSAHL
jgi:hypothetical protein